MSPIRQPRTAQEFIGPVLLAVRHPNLGVWWGFRPFVPILLSVLLFSGLTFRIYPAETVAAAETAYDEAKKNYDLTPQEPEVALKFAKATFDLAEIVSNNNERAPIAEQGIAACKRALEQASNSAPLHYYLGLNQGALARTKSLGALRLVDQMEREFTRSIELDSSFEYAGAERSLGLLYRDAPSFASIGSKSKARIHLQRAVELAPNYPDNRLTLIESELKWGDRKGARRDVKLAEDSWSAAKSEFTGPSWTNSWEDWEARLGKIKKILGEQPQLEAIRH